MVQVDSNTPSLPTAPRPQCCIRPARPQDIERLTDVLTSSFYDDTGWRQWVYPFIRLGIQEDLKQRIKASSARYACFTAVPVATQDAPQGSPSDGPSDASDASAIAGTVEASLRQPWPWQGDRHVYISNLAVAQSYRRQGIATALLQSCEQVAYRWQVRELHLHVMEDNTTAQALYHRAGFRLAQAESSPASWFGLQARRLLLCKTLPPP